MAILNIGASLNTVTTLTNLPVDKGTIYATLSGPSALSLSEPMYDGQQMRVVITPTTDFILPVPTSNGWFSTFGSSLDLKEDNRCAIDITCIGNGEYIMESKMTSKELDLWVLDASQVAIWGAETGKFYTSIEEWESLGRPTPNGIAVSDGRHRFCVALENITVGAGSYSLNPQGVSDVPIVSLTDCVNYFNGKGYTELLAQMGGTVNAARLCKDYVFPNGLHGYLPSTGELNIINSCHERYRDMLNACGGSLSTTDVDLCQSYLATSVSSNARSTYIIFAAGWFNYHKGGDSSDILENSVRFGTDEYAYSSGTYGRHGVRAVCEISNDVDRGSVFI